jgi:Acyl-CoA reductase (LuxC)
MNLQQRLEILSQLRQYISAQPTSWQNACVQAEQLNHWFTQKFIQSATDAIAGNFLNNDLLRKWADYYHLDDNIDPKTVGIVMAGNIPLVGFHDFLCVFVSGHKQMIKLSSKDEVLLKHLVTKMTEWNSAVADHVQFNSMLKDCDAYIATGSDNSARYFDYYFGRYPSIIRKNRTSVAILNGDETEIELSLLADDIMQYFGLGCRNITKLYVPAGYNFVPLLDALRKYSWMFNHHKYRNNYDYQLAIYLMNNIYYMTNDCVVLVENQQVFSPIGTLHYSFYNNASDVLTELKANDQVQAIVGNGYIPFGQAQQPGLMDYADGVDVMAFLLGL